MKNKLLSLVACLVLFDAPYAHASETPSIFSATELKQIAKDRERFLVGLSHAFKRRAADGVFTQSMLDMENQWSVAKARAMLAAGILQYDFNSDGIIDDKDYESLSALMPERRLMKAQAAISKIDEAGNGDGKVSFEELYQYSSETAQHQQDQKKRPDSLMRFDTNHDGKVVFEEILKAVHSVQVTQSPSAKETSVQDAVPQKPKTKAAAVETKEQACILPQPSEKAEIIYLNGSASKALSSVAVNGLEDETAAAMINIESGNRPLFIISAFSGSAVLKFTGDTSRIEKLVVSELGGKRQGIVGLKANQVEFTAQENCAPPYIGSPESGKAQLAESRLALALGHAVDKVIVARAFHTIGLPSGAIGENMRWNLDYRTRDPRRIIENKFRDFYPYGVEQFEVNDVIASGKVTAYDILPHIAGLIQLLDAGSLGLTDDEYFIIKKPISHFPAGMYGTFGGTFLLEEGVPLPAGNPGHAVVYDLATGKCHEGFFCPQ
ncbi:hypothetical protein [Cohaesibacter haloalkalitolerans]|uniref:hypothetical protein n=1 Tax=Cohaesibacter haloalkalitolerans TaxID=1162980 RepID=UPI000E64CABA|nr:hypothetical protein [Cohaesibacter haloalkalitolerans]